MSFSIELPQPSRSRHLRRNCRSWLQRNRHPLMQPLRRSRSPILPRKKKLEGARGLLYLCCTECGRTFGTFLREHQTEMNCKCGHPIDLTAPLARYRFTCPYCEKESWGQTNLEDPDITVRCKCGELYISDKHCTHIYEAKRIYYKGM